MELLFSAIGAAFGAIVGVVAERTFRKHQRRRRIASVHERTALRRAMGHAMGDSMRQRPLYEEREQVELECPRCGTKPVFRYTYVRGSYRCELCEYEWYWQPTRDESKPTFRQFRRQTRAYQTRNVPLLLQTLRDDGLRSALGFYLKRRWELRNSYEDMFSDDPRRWDTNH